MRFVDHHLAHAISAYGYSGFDDAAIVVMDGRGAWEATSIWQGREGTGRTCADDSVSEFRGIVLRAFTEYLGFAPNSDEWKVMGLAPYGEPGVKLRRVHRPGRSAVPRAREATGGTGRAAFVRN